MRRLRPASCRLLIVLAAGAWASVASAQVSGSGGIDPPRDLTPATKRETAAPSNVKTVDLRPKFRLNEPFKLRVEQSSKGSALVQQLDQVDKEKAEPQTQSMSQVFELRFVAREVSPSGAATVDMIVDAVKMSFKSGDIDVTFDSKTTKPASNPASKSTPSSTPKNASPGQLAEMDEGQMLASIVGPLVGSVTTLTFDESGNVTKVTGGEAWNFAGLASMMGGAGQMVPGAQPAAFGQLLNLHPGSNLARVGETWTTDAGASSSPVGNFSMNTRYTLRSASGSSANIDFNGAVEPGTASTMGFQVKEGSYRGQAEWDTGIGFLRSMRATTHVVLDGAIAGVKGLLDTTAQLDVKMIK